MTENRLSEIQQMGREGTAGTPEVIELLTEFFLSSSRHSKAIREAQAEDSGCHKEALQRLILVEAKLANIERLLRHPFGVLDIVERGDADEQAEAPSPSEEE